MSDLVNQPDPVLQGDELPTFRFALEKSEGKTLGGSYGKEATVKQLPISKGIAGVSMRLEPGVMRDPGDIWYFPRGHAHSIQCLGDRPCHFILVFDNGYFSEFGTFSVTDWIGHSPSRLLAKNLGLPEKEFDKLPKTEQYFVRGPVPPAEIPPEHRGPPASPPETHQYHMLAQAPHSLHTGGREWRVGQERFPISRTVTG